MKVDCLILEQLRTMARQGQPASRMLKKLHDLLPPQQYNTIALILCFRQAFALSLQEASPIGGWNADGTGEIPDDRLNGFLEPAIRRHKNEWDEE